jgi:hypothetical protein
MHPDGGRRGTAMDGRPTVLTQTVTATIVEQIRGGAVVETAAAAAGVSQATFHEWMALGEGGEEPFGEFATAVRQASARARLQLEQWVWEHDPLSWLLFGPGRERPGEPGWAKPAQLEVDPPLEEQSGAGKDDEESEWAQVLARAVREGAFGSDPFPPEEK